jgi:hypothetical protein
MKNRILLCLLLAILSFSSCLMIKTKVYGITHGNKTLTGYRKCASIDPYGWQFKNVRKTRYKLKPLKH